MEKIQTNYLETTIRVLKVLNGQDKLSDSNLKKLDQYEKILSCINIINLELAKNEYFICESNGTQKHSITFTYNT